MREILFRGQMKDGGVWVYGAFCGAHCETPFSPSIKQANIIMYDEPYDGYWVEVDPATVGQYTGMTDKNGTKIFEGDILGTTNSNSYIWYVDYKNTAFCCNQGNANYSCVLDEFMSVSAVEVIGNIHDNLELLGGNDG